MSNKKNLRNLTLTALFAAIIFLVTAYLLHIPIGLNGGYIHVGDAFVCLAAVMLPMPYAMVAAALGGMLADVLTGAAIWAIPTIIIKPLLVLPFTSKNEKILCKRNIVAIFVADITGLVCYAVAEGFIYGNWVAGFAAMVPGSLQPIASSVVFVLMGLAIDKMHLKERLLNPER